MGATFRRAGGQQNNLTVAMPVRGDNLRECGFFLPFCGRWPGVGYRRAQSIRPPEEVL